MTDETPRQKDYGPEDHQLSTRWYPGEDDKPRFEITCDCGKTRFKATIPNMKKPEVEEYMGLSLLHLKKDHKEYLLRKSLPRQLEHIAANRHLERFPDCPAIDELVTKTKPGKLARKADVATSIKD